MNTMSGSALRTSLLLPVALLIGAHLSAVGQIQEVGDGKAGPFKAEHLTVELTALSPQVTPGGTAQLGLVFSLEEHWHVYWINPGDAGEPPSIKWTLPAGWTSDALRYQPPTHLPLGPLMDYGYEEQAVYPVTITASPGARPGRVHLDAKVTWLVCASKCIPGKAHLGYDLDVVKGPLTPPEKVGALGSALATIPVPLPQGQTVTAVTDGKQIQITLKTGTAEEDAEFYPYDPDVIDNAASQMLETLPDGIRIGLTRAATSTSVPQQIHGLVELGDNENYEFTVPVTSGALTPISRKAPTKTGKQMDDTRVTVFGAIGLAFLGGIILNLMPCVFPVLFLKGLALVNTSQAERSEQRVHGLVYTLGILVSFWAIVAVLLVLRSGGQQIGWGFQLQSPGFVAVLALLVFFLGLSLAGQFELGLSLTSAGGSLTQKKGMAGSFFTGVLATVVATPCAGPFMGAAIGFALAQSPLVTFSVFTALALGLALPYLVLAMQPQWTRLLPRPGAWMELLKQLTAVPLFATAIWLVWVFGNLHAPDGVDHAASLLISLLIVAVAGWALGRWPAKTGSTIAAVALVGLALWLPLRTPKQETLTWEPYTTASYEAARKSGQPVFIDFTAAWCLSCQVNERAVLHSPEVESKLLAGHFKLLRADWTKYDPTITAHLQTLGRSEVPTYALYTPGENGQPDVLPELLTKDIVLKAIERDSK